MNIEVRPYTENDRAGFGHVRSVVYADGVPVRDDEILIAADCSAHVATIDGVVAGVCKALDFQTNLRGATVRCAGVAGVGVLPEYRSKGVGDRLMRGVLSDYRGAGYALASLYPFRPTYYARFGYANCGTRVDVTVPSARMPVRIDGIEARLVTGDVVTQIRPCYNEFARRFSGSNIRNDLQWWRALGGDTPFAVYAFGDPIEAYVVMRLEADFWTPFRVKELVWNTARGYRAAVALLAGYSLNKTTISWEEPGENPFRFQFDDQGTEYRITRPVMWRVVDVVQCLKAMRPEGEGSFQVEVIDKVLPENNAVYVVRYGSETVHAPIGGEPDFSMDIGCFSQAVLGEPCFASLLRSGEICVHNPMKVEDATRFFGRSDVYCLDAF